MSDIDLSKLSEPFDYSDIEWRVSRAGIGSSGIYCMVLCYITARAIQKRLDDVCGPENWKVETQMIDVGGKPAFKVGISIAIRRNIGISDDSDLEWVTKWDVCEPTNIEPAKGGFSGAMKRAGAQWGIGRYLYHLDETFADVEERKQTGREWNYAKVKTDEGPKTYYWKNPNLPAWALPKDDSEVSAKELNELKKAWKDKWYPNSTNAAEMREGFMRFVNSVVGEFPVADHTCWTLDAYGKVKAQIEATDEPGGVSAEIPFGAAGETK